MHKAVIFDLGRVVVNFDFARAYQVLEGLCPYGVPEMRERLTASDLANRFECGQIGPREFFTEISAALDFHMEFDRFSTIWSSIFTNALLPESLLEGLAARYRLLLLSNTNVLHFEMVRAHYPLLRHFHDYVLSYEVGAMKPQPEIYQAAIARAGCRAEECFYTDDIARFIVAARSLGIDGVQFESAEQVAGELRARGISW